MQRSFFVFVLLLATAASGTRPQTPQPEAPQATAEEPGAHALLLPDENGGHGLELQNDTLAWLRGIKSPVTVVTAIGQYRSGKSFLLNQLMQVPCDRGFGVGHRRETQTKGVWAYAIGPQNGTVRVYLDTEGFDATGKAAVYDDRIFAFSALVSSALVYNLVETIKEADIEKLSFVAQLAGEFWRRSQGPPGSSAQRGSRRLDEEDVPEARRPREASEGREAREARERSSSRRKEPSRWLPPALLWLVQRDFLQGSSVESYLREALKQQAHPEHDEHGHQLNAIRAQLSTFDGEGGGMAGFGLPQPHVQRTALCDLGLAAFSPEYLVGLQHVREWVAQHTSMSTRGGRVWRTGADLAAQVQQLVRVLNAQRIPTAGSVIDAFNRELVQRVLADLRSAMGEIKLPVSAESLAGYHARNVARAKSTLLTEGFGASTSSGLAGAEFDTGCADLLSELNNRNFRASHDLCKQLWVTSSVAMERLKRSTLPSRRRFRARIAECNSTLMPCVGPAAEDFHSRLEKAATDGALEYGEKFLAKLSQLLLLGCISGVLMFRYVLVSNVGEMFCWLLLAMSELMPRLNAATSFSPLTGQAALTSFWDTPTGSMLLESYEVIIFNEYADAEDWLQLVLIPVTFIFVGRRCYQGCRKCCGWDTPRQRRHRLRREMARRQRRTPRRHAITEPISDDEDDYDDGWDDCDDAPSSCVPLTRVMTERRGGAGAGGGAVPHRVNFI